MSRAASSRPSTWREPSRQADGPADGADTGHIARSRRRVDRPHLSLLRGLVERHAGKLKLVKVDVDRNPALAARFQARSIPTVVVLRDGREVDRIVGALSPAALEQRIAPLLAPA